MSNGNPFPWPAGKQAAISLSFDDARPSQLDVGIPLLDRCGAKATFYVSLHPFEQRLADWRRAAASGHEIGNHSVTHPCSRNFSWVRRGLEEFTLAEMAGELTTASDRIEKLSGTRPKTFAYPCGQKFVGCGENTQSYVPVVARQFLAGRGFRDESANDPARCDLAQLFGVDMDQLSFAEMKGWIDSAVKNHAWLVFAGHEVGTAARQVTSSAALEELCRYATAPGAGLWLDTVAAVGEWIKTKQE